MKQEEGRKILDNKGGLRGDEQDWNRLIDHYDGNPLALQLIAQRIKDLFNGNIAPFLKDAVIPRDIRDLLSQQFERLQPMEQEIMYWLTIEREAISLDEVEKNIGNYSDT